MTNVYCYDRCMIEVCNIGEREPMYGSILLLGLMNVPKVYGLHMTVGCKLNYEVVKQ